MEAFNVGFCLNLWYYWQTPGLLDPLSWRTTDTENSDFPLVDTEVLRKQLYQLTVRKCLSLMGLEYWRSWYYGKSSLDHLPKFLEAQRGPCWLKAVQCYSSLQKRCEGRPKELQTCKPNLRSWKYYGEDCTGSHRKSFKEQCNHQAQQTWVYKRKVLPYLVSFWLRSPTLWIKGKQWK